MERTRNIYPEIVRWLKLGQPLVLATIVDASGSTPQVQGASALFSERGLLSGTLGGGMLEADAQAKAEAYLGSGKSFFYRFDLHGQAVAEEEPICGGEVSILIDGSPVSHLTIFEKIRQSLESRRRGVLVTRIEAGPLEEALISRVWLGESEEPKALRIAGLLDLAEDIQEAGREGKPKLVRRAKNASGKGGSLYFLEPLSPLCRLLIAGAGHIGQAVARQGALLGFEVTVIDDRVEYANRVRFPEADRIVVDDIGRALERFPLSSDIYVVIVTRGHRHDAEALRACVRSSAAYLGMIGSRGKISLMRDQFIRDGWATAGEFDRVHAPIGLPIGSQTVEEIAVSIAAELVQVRGTAQEKKAEGGR
jgi:xanthine dehydrogenase accessory factor